MRRPLAASLIALAAAAFTGLLQLAGAIERLELLTLDLRYASGIGRKAPGGDVVIAWIDQESIEYMQQNGVAWPWPRSVYGDVLQHLRAAGARAVAFDVLFDQPGIADDDRAFGDALAAGKGDVLASKIVDRAPGLLLPIDDLRRGADRLGFVNIRADADKVYRRYDVARAAGAGERLESMAAAAAAAAGAEPALAASMLRERMLLNFRGPAFTFDRVKFVNVLESINKVAAGEAPLVDPGRFAGKIVLVGVHADGLEDAHPTPLAPLCPGVELHATAIDNLLRADWLVEPFAAGSWPPLFGLLGSALAVAAVFALRGVAAPMTALGLLLAASVAASGFAFAERIIVPMAAPLVGGGAAAAGAFAWRLVVEGRARREMKRAFASYLAPEVLAEVLRDPSRVALGGEQRTITVMFTDLQGFTGLAEHTRPQELVRFLNDYFTRMCAPILAERGVIDKFVGDAIMALFGAPLELPDHPARALRAALALAAASDRLAADLRAAGGPIVRTRIGLHTGEAVVGNMGSTQRFDYTAIGDTVNLAARLEGANRAFGTACLCSETTWGDGHGLLGRELGSLGVKGREAPIRVFTPVAAPDSATEAQRGLCARWQAAVAAAAARDRAALAAALQAVLALAPDDGPARAWSEALADADWDFTFRLDSK